MLAMPALFIIALHRSLLANVVINISIVVGFKS
jgi:hypothetical protein